MLFLFHNRAVFSVRTPLFPKRRADHSLSLSAVAFAGRIWYNPVTKLYASDPNRNDPIGDRKLIESS